MAKKLYYKIGEACKTLEIQPYVLRYWETEFPFLAPNKSKSGQRLYGAKELEIIRRIKTLLYDEGYTIPGAKKKLESELAGGENGDRRDPRPRPRRPEGRSVDSATSEGVEKLRRGLEGALRQTRDLLKLLETSVDP